METKNIEKARIEIRNAKKEHGCSVVIDLLNENEKDTKKLLNLIGTKKDKFYILNHQSNSIDIKPNQYLGLDINPSDITRHELTQDEVIKSIQEMKEDIEYCNTFDEEMFVKTIISDYANAREIAEYLVKNDVDRNIVKNLIDTTNGLDGVAEAAINSLNDKNMVEFLTDCVFTQEFTEEDMLMAICDDYFSDTPTPTEQILKIIKGFISLDEIVYSLKEEGQDQD